MIPFYVIWISITKLIFYWIGIDGMIIFAYYVLFLIITSIVRVVYERDGSSLPDFAHYDINSRKNVLCPVNLTPQTICICYAYLEKYIKSSSQCICISRKFLNLTNIIS